MTNPDLVWETTVSRNVGLDFGFFDNRLNGNLDLYLNTTHDQLILFPIKGAGYTHQYRNMGSTQNKGIELALNAVLVDKRDYSLQFSFNIAMNRNKVLDLGGLDRIEAYSSWASTQIDYDFVVTPGQSLGQIWGYVSDGRYPASDFTWTGSSWQANEGVLDNSHIAGNGWGPGAVRFRDLGGDPDAISGEPTAPCWAARCPRPPADSRSPGASRDSTSTPTSPTRWATRFSTSTRPNTPRRRATATRTC